MDDEPQGRKATSIYLSMIGVTAGIAALAVGGVIGMLVGSVAMACIVGSMAVSLFPEETPYERWSRECDEVQAIAAFEPGVSPSQDAEPGQHWRQSVTASRCTTRRR